MLELGHYYCITTDRCNAFLLSSPIHPTWCQRSSRDLAKNQTPSCPGQSVMPLSPNHNCFQGYCYASCSNQYLEMPGFHINENEIRKPDPVFKTFRFRQFLVHHWLTSHHHHFYATDNRPFDSRFSSSRLNLFKTGKITCVCNKMTY